MQWAVIAFVDKFIQSSQPTHEVDAIIISIR